MKTLKFLAFVGILALAFTSCKKEEEFTLVGKWNVDKVTTTAFLNGQQVHHEEETNQGWIQFFSGNTGVDDDGGTFQWSLSGDNLTITFDDPDEGEMASFTFKLTTKTLQKIVAESTFEESYEIEGQVYTVSVNLILELSKL
ncbi:MAG: lipocalin family protein [Tenuifilaceae bacterium]|jgi:hypothetical protein|nr:lipocalin family protein [Bacteroidales bacterium]MDI9516219.1 lipocalin family protein [Bacteroidota bacterium]NLH55943.1 hypothetical protein [Rikenellaceae bacterium]OQC64920.1 MAG: hypothetical protein BWX49_00291 [Bacteroidetes bacterium ADurb.Bin008]HNV80403.1 lipocalin family protein [Tenuifilaceae bacterium]